MWGWDRASDARRRRLQLRLKTGWRSVTEVRWGEVFCFPMVQVLGYYLNLNFGGVQQVAEQELNSLKTALAQRPNNSEANFKVETLPTTNGDIFLCRARAPPKTETSRPT